MVTDSGICMGSWWCVLCTWTNHVPYQRTDGLKAGNTIKKITYLLKDSADIVINTNIKLKTLIDAKKVKGTADKATYSANGTAVKFNFENLPAEDYKVATVAKRWTPCNSNRTKNIGHMMQIVKH